MQRLWLVFVCLFLGAALTRKRTRRAPQVWEHGWLRVNGVRLHYVSAGNGPLILFLHGFPELWYAWKAQLAEFGGDYRAVAVDMRGYNLSDKPGRVADYALPALAADVKALLEELGGGSRAVLVGHDWGGIVAWALAALHPEVLERLVIINAPHPALFLRELRRSPAQRLASSYVKLFRSRLAEPLLRFNRFWALRQMVFGMAKRGFSRQDRRAYLRAWSEPGAITGGLSYYRALDADPVRIARGRASASVAEGLAQVGRIRVPTLVLWGMQDRALLPGNLEGLESVVEDLIVERIPNGTHWVVHEQPHRVNRGIRAFLESRK